MVKKNRTIDPVSDEVTPNGFYLAYQRFFNEVFIQKEIEQDKLQELYIFDRHAFSEPKYVPKKGWEKIDVIEDPELHNQFEINEQLGIYEKQLLSFLLINAKPKQLKIVGEIGSGKSTFLRHLFFNYLPKQKFTQDGFLYLHFNLEKIFRLYGSYERSSVFNILVKEFPRVIKEASIMIPKKTNYIPMTLEEQVDYLREYVKVLGTRKVIVCFDNVDIFHSSFQEILWNYCEDLADQTGATIIISMRKINSRYFESISHARFSSYFLMEQRPPVLTKVVERRLKYFAKVDPLIKENRRLRIRMNDITVSYCDFEEFIDNLVKIIINDEISKALDNLSNYNVQVGLWWMLNFIQSWNLNVVQMVSKLTKEIVATKLNDPYVTFDTLLNAIGLWNHRTYFPRYSSLENIFSANLNNPLSDLLIKYRCLKYCACYGEGTKKNDLVHHLRIFKYTDSEIKETVEQLLAHPKRLLISFDGDGFDSIKTMIISASGKYYLNKLLFYLDYYEIISADCYMPEHEMKKTEGKVSYIYKIIQGIKLIRQIGEREAYEIKIAITEQKISKEDYNGIYGSELLAVSILRAIKDDIRAIFNTIHHPMAVQQCNRMIHLVDSYIKRFSENNMSYALSNPETDDGIGAF